MRIERWYWLGVFCAVSFVAHLILVASSRSFATPVSVPKTEEIEVALLPPEKQKPPKPAEPPKPEVKPQKPAEEKRDNKPPLNANRNARRPAPVRIVRAIESPKVKTDEERPSAPAADPGGVDRLKEEKPLPLGLPTGQKADVSPQLPKIVRNTPQGGGGSPAPDKVLSGKGGAPGPIAPPEDIVFSGGGAGGVELPRAAPRIGGGGGKSILSIENPLAKEAVPEEKPGLGPGLGGNQGLGAGGGVGAGRDKGIGTRLDGKYALSTLRAKPGPGIGAGEGSNIGTKPPGGGKGTGAELPGTGGSGIGYGRGSGVGIGNGSGTGVGDGSGGRPGRLRGMPFGDIAGLLNGDPNGGGGKGGGPGGSGRGGVFGLKGGGGGGDGPMHICYVLDVSGSMEDGDKIGKAKEALKKALSELKRKDSFNIITFAGRVYSFADDMIPAEKGNIEAANLYIDIVRTKPATNLEGALRSAFAMQPLTHIYVLSDGEPTVGLGRRNPDELIELVRELNTMKAQVLTLALGLGERFRGMALLRALAEDNNGRYSYVNLGRGE